MTETVRSQRGAVVVEFALVFSLFILVVSGIISFGAAFAAQQSVTHAAAEGARGLVGFTGPSGDYATRVDEVIGSQLDWLEDTDVTTEPCPSGPAGCWQVRAEGASPVPQILPLVDGAAESTARVMLE